MVSYQTPEVQPHSQFSKVISELDFSQNEVFHVHLYPRVVATNTVNILLCEKGKKKLWLRNETRQLFFDLD